MNYRFSSARYFGMVIFSVFLIFSTENTHAQVPTTTPSASNVLFIPGFQASRLYFSDGGENRLWEPNSRVDVPRLYLDEMGSSTMPGIYTRDVIDEVGFLGIGTINIYKNFISFMDGLKDDDVINDWSAFPYDWRMDIADVLSPRPVTHPVVALKTNTNHVGYLGRITLTWNSTNAESCTASGRWSGPKPTSGSELSAQLTANSTFTLMCTGPGGMGSSNVSIGVSPPDFEEVGKRLGLNPPTLKIFSSPESFAGARLQNSIKYLDEEVLRLASSSKSGKVTIIAHSNGGFIAKQLVTYLNSIGKAHLVDRVILVAVPQLGTPKAIAGLLHGDEQQILGGILLGKSGARELGENMSSAYNLLPSPLYFDRVTDPVVEFDASVAEIPELTNLANTMIASSTILHQFLTGNNGAWSEPPPTDTDTPNVLDTALFASSTATHATLDTWTPPAGVEVIQIAGWGLDTIRGIRYDNCDIPLCPNNLSHLDRAPLFVVDGDGTVVLPSAIAMGGIETYYIHLRNYNREGLLNERKNRSHASILEAEPLRELIENILLGGSELPSHISVILPVAEPNDRRLRFRLHSPVELHLYDSSGAHTGISTSTNFDLRVVEEQIPNSYYTEFGEVKYAGTDSATTTLQLVGLASGIFTLDIDELRANELIASSSFIGIPVTASTTATLVLQNLAGTEKLYMDFNVDGITDAFVSPGDGVSVIELLDIVTGILKSYELGNKEKGKLLKKITKLKKELNKERNKENLKKQKIQSAFSNLVKIIKRFENRGILTPEEATTLATIISRVLGQI